MHITDASGLHTADAPDGSLSIIVYTIFGEM